MKTLSILTSALLIMGVSTLASGQTTEKNATTGQQKSQVTKSSSQNTQRPYFVDKDNNGVCDNFESGNRRQGQRMGRGQGRGRNQGKGLGRGNGRGRGRGQGMRGRGGNGNFVDTNKDGVCDRLQNGTGRQRLRDGSGRNNLPTNRAK